MTFLPSTTRLFAILANAGRQSFRESKVVATSRAAARRERTRRDGISAGVTDGRRFYEYQP